MVLLVFVGFITFFMITLGGMDAYAERRSSYVYMVFSGLWFTGIMLLLIFLLTRIDRTSLRYAGLGGFLSAPVHFVSGLLLWLSPSFSPRSPANSGGD